MKILNYLENELQALAIAENKTPMEQYMRNRYSFYGVRSPERRAAFKKAMQELPLPSKENYKAEVLAMLKHPKREMHHCGIDLALKCQKKYSTIEDIDYINEMLATNSWWDTVDTIAPKILGKYLQDFPEKIEETINFYLASDNRWWHRSSLLFQLKYKAKTDKELLFALCEHFSKSKEFFIQKAIGWVLREYARTDAAAVYHFVDNTPLANLSVREANKHRK